jgi:hypothetical protein
MFLKPLLDETDECSVGKHIICLKEFFTQLTLLGSFSTAYIVHFLGQTRALKNPSAANIYEY